MTVDLVLVLGEERPGRLAERSARTAPHLCRGAIAMAEQPTLAIEHAPAKVRQ